MLYDSIKYVIKQLTDDFFFFVFDSIPNQYNTQEMSSSIISEDPFSIRYVLDQYKTQQMCDKTIIVQLH